MPQLSNLKATVQECQRKHKTIPPSEIKELHCNKVPLILQEGREKSHDCKFQFLLLHDNI